MSEIRCYIQGVLELRALNRKGVLKPKESRMIVMQLHSFDKPCKIRIQMPCKILDHSKYYLHRESLKRYNARQEEIKKSFIITNSGITYPINEVKLQPCPKAFYSTISIDVSITSIMDRDLHYGAAEQLRHSPQYLLRYGKAIQLKALAPKLDPLDKPVRKSMMYPKIDLKSEDNKDLMKLYDKRNEDFNVPLIKNTVEAILADAVFSNLFLNAFTTQKQVPNLYYSQIKSTKSTHKIEKVKELYEVPQPPIISEVLRELIIDGLHEILLLGPRVKEKVNASTFGQPIGCRSDANNECSVHTFCV